jgi:hypothetical protein
MEDWLVTKCYAYLEPGQSMLLVINNGKLTGDGWIIHVLRRSVKEWCVGIWAGFI